MTVRVEFTVAAGAAPGSQAAAAAAGAPGVAAGVEGELNGRSYTTRGGDPIRFRFDFRFREPGALETPGYHQVEVVDNPKFRSGLDAVGTPNQVGVEGVRRGTFSRVDITPPRARARDDAPGRAGRPLLRLLAGGRPGHPLPDRGLTRAEVRAFARAHRPPLPPPPAGRVVVKNIPGTNPCDQMGTGFERQCRKLSRRDLDWLESQAGVKVAAQPGDVLANKDVERQDFGIGFTTVVFARPGATTTADGISVYCLDKSRFIPFGGAFDVVGPARALPGYAPLAALLELNGRVQPSLEESVPGMAAAVWNVTDAAPLATSGTAEESRPAGPGRGGRGRGARRHPRHRRPQRRRANHRRREPGRHAPGHREPREHRGPAQDLHRPALPGARRRAPAGLRRPAALDGRRRPAGRGRPAAPRGPELADRALLPLAFCRARPERAPAGARPSRPRRHRVVVTVTPGLGPRAELRVPLAVTAR